MLFGITMCPAAIVRASQRVAQRCVPTYRALVHVIRSAPVVYSDETGWHIVKAAKKAWLWVFTSSTPKITVYAIRLSRGNDVVVEILGAEFDGVLGIDGWAGYDKSSCRKGQCNVHFLRRCAGLLDVQKPYAARFAQAVRQLLLAGMQLKKRAATLTMRTYRGLSTKLRNRMTRLLRVRMTNSLNVKFRKHLLRHEDEDASRTSTCLALSQPTIWANRGSAPLS